VPLYIEVGVQEESKKGEWKKLIVKSTSIGSLTNSEVRWPLEAGGVRYGVFRLYDPVMSEDFSFLDYVHGGVSLKLCLGFDWTASNNRPDNEMHTEELDKNPYALIMRSLLRALLCFDQDGRVPVLGTAGVIPQVGLSYCFALNGKLYDPEVVGLSSIIELYLNALRKTKLGGPSIFGELLKYYADFYDEYMKSSFSEFPRYFVLILMIDGSPIDIDETREGLVRLSYFPVTTIIVSTNAELCKPFKEVITEEVPLFSKTITKYAKRDSIIYVDTEISASKMRGIVKSIFPILQKQFVDYMCTANINPTIYKDKKPSTAVSKDSMESTFPPYVKLLNYYKRAILELRYKMKEQAEEDDKDKSPKKDKKTPTDKEDPEKIEEEKKDREEIAKIETILEGGFPARDPYNLLDVIKLKEYTNVLLIDDSLKNLIIQ
jgi:hypothetical protein